MSVPTLDTERLMLRAHRLEDFASCANLWADPAVTRYIGGVPLTAEESWARLLRYAGHWALLGFGYWVVEENATGEFIGEIGFADLKRDLDPPLGDIPEAGWVFLPAAHGNGYATEALEAILSWGESHFTTPQTACIIHPDNAASIRVAEKCGYREMLRTTYKGKPTVVFFRDRPNNLDAMAGYDTSHEKYGELYKKLAE
jgi:RimJ/RimL family protein N-acetyltransferase